MNLNQLNDELKQLAEKAGITIRKDNGHFRGGFCKIDDKKVIVLNRNSSKENVNSIIARCFGELNFEGLYIKPAVRDFIESEINNGLFSETPVLKINY